LKVSPVTGLVAHPVSFRFSLLGCCWPVSPAGGCPAPSGPAAGPDG